MQEANFVHLHVHSEYSIEDSLLRVETIVARAKADHAKAVCITDMHSIFAAVKLYQCAKKHGIKPIIGSQVRIYDPAPESTSAEQATTTNTTTPYYDLLLYCQNEQGYANLCMLLTKSYQQGQHHGKAYLHRSWLNQQSCSGLIAVEPGLWGYTATQKQPSCLSLSWWEQVFPERYYLGLHRLGLPGEAALEAKIATLCEQRPRPLIALNFVCFADLEDYEAHEVRVCIQHGQVLDARGESNYSRQQFWRSSAQMQQVFKDIPFAISNTYALSQRLQLRVNFGNTHLPDFPVKSDTDLIDHLITLSTTGLAKRLQCSLDSLSLPPAQHLATRQGEIVKTTPPENTPDAVQNNTTFQTQDYQQRLQTELAIIVKMQFPGYFLIVADFIQWAKQNSIPVGPGRGSGAGSLVAYALGITDVDPLPHGLLFERFLNPERVSMPDFDIDFCMLGRDRVIEYVGKKYGHAAVAQIITHGTMAAKAAIRDVGRALALPYGFVDKIAKLIPNDLGITIKQALAQSPDLHSRYQQDAEVTPLIDMALKLEGCVRNLGRHAGGVVISPGKLTDFCPLYQEEGSQHQVTQFDMNDVEKIGLVKFDFLGLRTLTIIDQTIRSVRMGKPDEAIDINHIALDDELTFRLLRSGNTTAVFQLESRGFQDLIFRLQPDSFADIVALVALYRPGPLQTGMVDDFIDRKKGLQKVSYLHPCMQSILAETYGVIVYQEQVMQIAQAMAGYSLGGADLLRRAMGKKKPEEMAKQRDIFLLGSKQQSIDPDLAGEVFDLMEKFAGYGFNKSHSVAYALIAYQTAYLKAHYLDYFMAAVLSSDMDNTDKVVHYCTECEARGLRVLPPDVFKSKALFTVEKPMHIRFGLGAVKGVGEGMAAQINQLLQQAKSTPTDLLALCICLEDCKLNRKVLEALIHSGALDGLEVSRSILLASIETVLAQKEQYCRDQQAGQVDLFSSCPQQPPSCQYANPLPRWRLQEQLRAEKAALGRYFSAHPLDPYQAELSQLSFTPIANIRPKAKQQYQFAGLINKQKRMSSKQGRAFILMEILDKSGVFEIACFDDKMAQAQQAEQDHEVVVISGQFQSSRNGMEPRFALTSIISLEQVRQTKNPALCLNISYKECTQASIELILHHLQANPGHSSVYINYHCAQQCTRLAIAQQLRTAVNEDHLQTILEIPGVQTVELCYGSAKQSSSPSLT